MTTVRTHCYKGCEQPLYNQLWGTYHLTIANQPTNVICPTCGAFLMRNTKLPNHGALMRWTRNHPVPRHDI